MKSQDFAPDASLGGVDGCGEDNDAGLGGGGQVKQVCVKCCCCGFSRCTAPCYSGILLFTERFDCGICPVMPVEFLRDEFFRNDLGVMKAAFPGVRLRVFVRPAFGPPCRVVAESVSKAEKEEVAHEGLPIFRE